MIRRIQALNYRCLRHVDVRLDNFHLLVGPNASGKSTLLDVVSFLSDLISVGLEDALKKRTGNFQDLVWGRPQENLGFELALEFDIPEELQKKLPTDKNWKMFRYEVAIKENPDDRMVYIDSERGILSPELGKDTRTPTLFPDPPSPPETILFGGRRGSSSRSVLRKSRGRDNFTIEVTPAGKDAWVTSIVFGPRVSTLRNLPESPKDFPVATYAKRVLRSGIQSLFLDSSKLRQPSPPNGSDGNFATDGSRLPWAVQRLKEQDQLKFKEWLDHVCLALHDLEDIQVVEQKHNRHAYLLLRYKTGLEIPSWMTSDGTLRLLTLTLAAYLPDVEQIYLLEEPENGIHPLAIEVVHQSLKSFYRSQILVATHSPTLLYCSEPGEVLCFAKNKEGATDIVRGDHHPRLRGWKSVTELDVLFAPEILS